jgi:hypothetical protein
VTKSLSWAKLLVSDISHLVHYKKGGLVLIIRKILTKNMYHDVKFLIFVERKPSQKNLQWLMDRTVLLLDGRFASS